MNLEQLDIFKNISFAEDAHAYFINEQPASDLSVTKLIKRFKKEFEADEIAARIAVKTGVTPEQIKEDWARNRDRAATTGTLLHKYIEEHYTSVPKKFDLNIETLGYEEKRLIKEALPILIKQFHSFYQENPHLKCVSSELVVGDLDDTRICGTVDMLVLNENTKQLEMYDFKTNKKMQKQTTFRNLFYPFDDMCEGEINEYTIQLNTYKYFIEKYTDLKVSVMKLVWFNIKNDTYQLFELEDIQPKIVEMFNRVKATALFQDKILTK
jgi:hypothetical protein